LSRLECAIPAGDDVDLCSLFRADSYWRDMLAPTWILQTCCGGEAIAERLAPALRGAGASGFRVELSRLAPRIVTRVETETIEAFFTFETGAGRGRGIV
jgi:hypothetical protein